MAHVRLPALSPHELHRPGGAGAERDDPVVWGVLHVRAVCECGRPARVELTDFASPGVSGTDWQCPACGAGNALPVVARVVAVE